MIIFCDIDGVLANCDHRLHYLENKDYDTFYSADELLEDTPIEVGIDLVSELIDLPTVDFNYLTGRPYRTQDTTEAWLARYGLESPLIFMRKDHDYRKSEVVKSEILDKYFENVAFEGTVLFIDDDPLNVAGVCSKHPFIKGVVFGVERLNRVLDLADRYRELVQ